MNPTPRVKRRRRLLQTICLLCIVVLVAACGPAATPQATQPAATQAPATAAATTAPDATPVPSPVPTVERTAKGGIRQSQSGYEGTLTLWVLGYTPGNAFANPFDNAVAQFMADNPNIRVDITGYPPNDEGFTRLSTALQSGQGIDLLRLPSDRLPGFVRDDLIEPIDPYLTEADQADYFPNILDVVRLQDGQAYAWPLWVVPMGMYLNVDVFNEAGVELPPNDWTWDQFVEAAKALTFQRANGEQVYGFSGFVDPGVVNTWGLWMNEDPSVRPIRPDGTYGLNSEQAVAGLQRFADLARVHQVTPPDFGSQQDADVKGGFTNGQYAMIVDATGPAAQFKGAGVNFEIYPLPTVNGNKLTVGAVGLIAVARTDDEVKRQAAMDLARYLTSAEVQEDVPPGSNVPTGFYLAPGARRSVQVVDPLDKFLPVLPDMWITPLVPDWARFTRLIHPEYQNIIFGQTDPAEAMNRIAPEAQELLGISQ
jgi:multiple sugar transport system substrate-binding protein